MMIQLFGGVTKHSSSENSKARSAVDDLANIVNNTNIAFIDAPFATDIEPVIEPPTVQISITLADDDPKFNGEVMKHSLSENSKTRIAVDDLANIVNNITKPTSFAVYQR